MSDIEVTDPAIEQIGEYFKDKEASPIRVFLNEGGWGGPSFAMALDEPKETDNTYEVGNYKFIVDKAFMEKATPIKVDFTQFGFSISSSIELGQGCGGSCGDSAGAADSGCGDTGSCCGS